MKYTVRQAKEQDLERIEEIYAAARAFMAANGNPNQWGTHNPPHEQLVQDIDEGKLYVITDGETIHGVFFFWIGEDPTYKKIAGAWHSDRPYGTIHRIAGDGSGGILRTSVAFAKQHIGHLRIDTHEDNKVMQRAIQKVGFQRCGIIHIADGSPRIAYDLVTVREAEMGDLQEILALYLYLHETSIPEETEHLKSTWQQILEDKNHHLIVYEQEGRIVSSCVCVIIPNLTRGVRPYAFVENVVTHGDHRGKGYASRCLDYARQIARENNCYKMMLLTGSNTDS